MIPIPDDEAGRLTLALELKEQCRVSVGMRTVYYRMMNAITETGRYNGTKSLINMMYSHLERTAAHLFSPIELKFSIDYERPRGKVDVERAKEAAKVLTRDWNLSNTDIRFGRGVFEGLKYGACFLKQWVEMEGPTEDQTAVRYDKLVMPWQMGVYREDENSLDRQEAICETSSLTMPEIWKRIWHLPNSKKLYERIKGNAKKGEMGNDPQSYFHQVLSTSQIQTGVLGQTGRPGGIMQLSGDPNYSVMGPVIAPDTVEMHEIWVKGENDYVTFQIIEPDILIAPMFKKANLLGVDREQPYRLIQPNEVSNWIWGRSELVDLIEPQALLATWCDDVKRLFGLQVDKILAFVGEGGITDEIYGQFRQAGYINLGQQGSVNDLTPKMPPESIPMLKFVIEIINMLGSFPEIMQGRGEPGVRAGVHASTLLKTAAPTMRDRALLVERQCAMAADLTLAIKEAKDPDYYWLKADDPVKDVEETKFLLSELPDDRRVTVDSHSASPIFSDENAQLIFQGHKSGIVTGEYVLDNMPFPNREMAKVDMKEQTAAKAKMFQDVLAANPEAAAKLLEKGAA